MGLITRGNMLWLRVRGIDGKWRARSSGFRVGEEAKALAELASIEAEIAATVPAG